MAGIFLGIARAITAIMDRATKEKHKEGSMLWLTLLIAQIADASGETESVESNAIQVDE